MRLKSIKLVGFKSFVDSTVVPFPSNMTAIVGPNGCGKSNVIDAVRWVMGESSAKHLRGESMTDVIFNGSTHRQPVGQASIELLFDNSEGTLIGEHGAFSEISIKRKVTREGVSQYYLNGSKCRRRDVTDIFLGTGMGPRSYAIIEQGMISRLIESKPEELRVYLEEAAGISKYKERRRETENRMRRTTENLERLADIREELAKQLSTLKRQANAAERYKEYKAQERKLTALLAAFQWQDLAQQLASYEADVTKLESDVEMLVLDKATGQSKIEAVRAQLEEALAEFQELQGKYYQTGADIAKLEQEIKFEREKAQRSAEEKSRVSDELRRSEERALLLSEELSERSLELEELLPEIELLLEAQEVQLEAVHVAEENFQQWLQQNESIQEKHTSARSKADALQASITRSESVIQQANDRLVRLNEERERLSQEGLGGDLEEQVAHLEEVKADFLHKEASIDLLSKQVEENELAYNEALQKRDQEKAELSRMKAVLASLETLQSEAMSSEGEPSGFKRYADERKFTTVLDRIKVENEWASVVENVLADLLYANVVETGFDELPVSKFINDSFTVLDGQKGVVTPIAGTLSGKISGLDGLYAILNHVLIADSLDDALMRRATLNDGQTIATRDGFILSSSWLKSYGESDGVDSVVTRQQRIDQMKKDVFAAESVVDVLQVACFDLLEEKNSLKEELRSQRNSLKELNSLQVRIGAEVSAAKAKKEQFLIRVERCDEELLTINSQIIEERAELEENRTVWESALLDLDEMSEQRTGHNQQRDILRDAIERTRDQQRDTQSKLHALTLSKQKNTDRLELLNQQHSDLLGVIEERRFKLEELVEVETDMERVEALSANLQDELVLHERQEKRLVEAREAQENLQLNLRDGELARDKAESLLSEKRSFLEQQRLKQQALVLEQSHQLEKVSEDGFELDVLLNELRDEPQSDDELSAEIERVATRVQRLGPINLAAVEEYEVQSERKRYLDAQDEELQEALSTLTNAIRKIDKETRTRFKETYDLVNSGLQDLFPKIFGGGSAKLELTDSDLLETGVSIIARPPGKNNSTIHLLSGGEKALTALALIFSIFKLNPAPFCMLDEVDAPLDDANVGRFARLVKEMSTTVQFIYISHNKVSMEMADQLMGVTMHEPGVSRLVSVDVDAAAKLAEA